VIAMIQTRNYLGNLSYCLLG